MSELWSDFVKKLKPYVPGEQPRQADLVKLNTNENPYPPSPSVAAVLAGECLTEQADGLRLYPDPESTQLLETIAGYFSVRSDQVFVGNGSDEVLAHAFNAFFRDKGKVQFPDITYSFYPVYCKLFGIEFEAVPLGDDFSVDLGKFAASAGGIIIANPNAPTGVALDLDAIEQLAAAHPQCVVIVDEAYVDFGAESAVSLIDRYKNLLVVQTVSKSRSLAGVRVGYAIGDAALIDALQRVKNSFNSYPLGRLAQAAVVASFGDEDYFRATVKMVVENRDCLVAGIVGRGFDVVESCANFVFAKPPVGRSAGEWYMALRDRNILVRHFTAPRVDEWLRITVGTPSQHERLFAAIDDIAS